MKRLITAESVTAAFKAGARRVPAPAPSTIITPAAWTAAFELGVVFDQSPEGAPAKPVTAAPEVPRIDRVVDPSGLIVVRGKTVELGEFSGAGPGRHIGLTDVVTGKDGSPMTAGFMEWSRVDSFPWKLDYAEIDSVLEGVLHLGIEGRVLEARPGDVVFIPKGSSVIFGTPTRVKLFYVTYPADWQTAK